MEPVSIIVTALIAGAAAGGKDAASSAVKDAYTGLHSLLTRHLAPRSSARRAITGIEEHAPELAHRNDGVSPTAADRVDDEDVAGAWRSALIAELSRERVGEDASVLAAAETLLEVVSARPARGPTFQVRAEGSYGVVVGSHNTVHQSFGTL